MSRVDELAALTCEASAAAPLQSAHLSSADLADLNTGAALMLAYVIGRRVGVHVPILEAGDELVQALTATYMSREQRRDVVRAIYSDQVRAVLAERDRPDPADGPIASLGTPITAVTRTQQRDSLRVADALAEVVREFGWQPDIPGHAIDPAVPGEDRSQVAREITSRSSLLYASAFVGIDSHLGRRGLGFAVRQAEGAGSPVLLLPRGVEEYGFARVFRERFAHREEVVVDDLTSAQTSLRAFLRGHTPCIVARHRRVVGYRTGLEALSRQLTRQLATVDLALVAKRGLTPAGAHFLVSDPIHLGQSQPWELEELALLLGTQPDLLKRLVLLDGVAHAGVRRSPRPRHVGRGRVTSVWRMSTTRSLPLAGSGRAARCTGCSFGTSTWNMWSPRALLRRGAVWTRRTGPTPISGASGECDRWRPKGPP